MKNVLPFTILRAQIVNGVFTVLFFYFIPYFSITPKTNLFIYLIVSFLIFSIWRIYLVDLISPKTKEDAMLIARGEEMKQLKEEINLGNYGFQITHSINLDKVESIDIQTDIVDPIYSNSISTVIIDTRDDTVLPLLPSFYNLMFAGIKFFDVHETYEFIFNRIPLSLVKHGWFLENVRTNAGLIYDIPKRITDIILSLILGLIFLVMYPIVFVFLKFDGGEGFFSIQERVGQNNKIIKLYKFRTMKIANDNAKWQDTDIKNEVTKIGAFLRKTRIDELPQLWNVIRGDMSLIGPRPEFPNAVEKYNEEIPYYNVRHLIKPGLSGWAQIYGEHPHHEADISMTKNKLSHDLYYIKNRSLLLDLKIALKTLRTIVSQKGK